MRQRYSRTQRILPSGDTRVDSRLILTALQLIRDDYLSSKLIKQLRGLAGAATTASQNPADAGAQNAFTSAVEQVQIACREAKANKAPLSLRKVIERVGLLHLVGEVVEARIHGILTRTPFIAAQAAEAITKLLQQLEQDVENKVTPGASLLEQMGIRPLQRDPQLAEVGILLPTSVVHDDLTVINKHLRQWERVIAHFDELATGKPSSSVKVAAVSSGSFELYLNLDLDGAKAIALVVSTILGGFIALSRFRKTRETMQADNYPPQVIEGAKKHEDELLNNTVEAATNAALKGAKASIEVTRVNELKTAIKRDVHFIATSINQGVDVEVSPPQIAEGKGQPENAHVVAELRELSAKVSTLTRTLTDRSAPIAELPETVE